MTSSIKDVAERAGVSLGTVSNVLNRPDLVRPATRERVEAAIAELGYVRNDSARQLRAGVSRSLAYVCLDAANPFFTDVSRGIDEVARSNRLTLFLCDSQQDAEREDDVLVQLLEQRVRGICITPVDGASPRLAAARARGVPIVMVDRAAPDDDAPWCSVGVDDILGGRLAIDHLAEGGHRRVAFAGEVGGIPQSRDRLQGARAACDERGIELSVVPTDGMSFADGRAAGAALLGSPVGTRPSAVFCANDLIALGVLQTMTENGVAVPHEMAIVGYDDIVFAGAAAVPLTSVRQPSHELGRCAAQLLLAEAGGAAHEHENRRFLPELVVRRSTRA